MKKVNLKPELWKKISDFQIDDPNSALTFTRRLCRENGWSHEYAKRVIDEYKKYVYLSLIVNTSLTPSDEVDQAWHLHMLYTKSYWNDFCKNTLGGINFHHGPTKGGKSEGEKFDNQYNYTLDLYKEVFGYDAPTDIWPDSKTRFSNINYRRVNMHENIVLNKKKVKKYMLSYVLLPLVILMAGLLMSANTKAVNETDWASVFMWIGGILLVIFIIRGIVRYINRNNRGGKGGSSSGSSSSSGDSGCTFVGSFLGCGGSGCGSDSSSGCGSSGCGGGGCGGGGCGGCGG